MATLGGGGSWLYITPSGGSKEQVTVLPKASYYIGVTSMNHVRMHKCLYVP